MSWRITETTDTIDWHELSVVMQRTGMGERDAADVEAVFTGSYACCFAWQQHQLIGGARAISDGYRSSAIYDVFVDRPFFNAKGLGTR